MREPLGVFGTVAIPVRDLRGARPHVRAGGSAAAVARRRACSRWTCRFWRRCCIALSAVLSLVTIISIYREGGILKRLRATPLRPYTILSAHVIVKLMLHGRDALALTVLAGRRYYPVDADVPLLNFAVALMFSTVCILSIGFLIASIVPTARFAQPIGAIILYPMLGRVGAVRADRRAAARAAGGPRALLPLTYAVSLLRGIWNGAGWMAHASDMAVLSLVFVVCTALSAKVFRWE